MLGQNLLWCIKPKFDAPGQGAWKVKYNSYNSHFSFTNFRFGSPQTTEIDIHENIDELFMFCVSVSASMGQAWLQGMALQVQNAPRDSLFCLMRTVLVSSGWSWSLSVCTVAWRTT